MRSPESVLKQVQPRIVPSGRERAKMASIAERLKRDVETVLAKSRISGTVTIQGSFARDTWLSEETDLDIFIRLPQTMERKEWVDVVLPSIRNALSRHKIVERYAEHPFLEFHVDEIRVNIVPCYDVEKGDWKSATDRTPYHTEFMKTNLTQETRLEARLLKKFAKGIRVYGAEIEIGGFSGMLVDTLALYYHTFMDAIKNAASWTAGTRLEIGKPAAIIGAEKRERGVDLVVIDPVDSDRNLAAAVRPDKLWSFVAAARQFLREASLEFFFPRKFTKKTHSQFSKRIKSNKRELVAISFKHPVLVPDVLWGQLMKLEKSLVELITREEFLIHRSMIWSDEKSQSAVLLEADREALPATRIQIGPPVAKREDSLAFLDRHLGIKDTLRGPWIENDRWVVEKKRPATTIQALLKETHQKGSQRLPVPRQIGKSFPNTVKVLQGTTVLSLLGRKGFDKALWEFLEAKPSWLKPVQS